MSKGTSFLWIYYIPTKICRNKPVMICQQSHPVIVLRPTSRYICSMLTFCLEFIAPIQMNVYLINLLIIGEGCIVVLVQLKNNKLQKQRGTSTKCIWTNFIDLDIFSLQWKNYIYSANIKIENIFVFFHTYPIVMKFNFLISWILSKTWISVSSTYSIPL